MPTWYELSEVPTGGGGIDFKNMDGPFLWVGDNLFSSPYEPLGEVPTWGGGIDFKNWR